MKKLHRHHLGQIGQLKVELEASKKGLTTSLPTLPVRYDILLDDGKKIYKAQIKYCNNKSRHPKDKDWIMLLLERKHINQKKYNKNDVDLLLVYLPVIDKVLAFPPKLFHNRARIYINIRNKNSTRYWEKFIW